MFKSVVLAMAMVFGLAAAGQAADFPEKPIQVVVPWNPGGGSDISARILADGMKDMLSQPLVVSNISGAMGLNAALQVKNSRPDGYTLIWEHPGNLAVAPMLANVPFTWKDFDTVCMVAKSDSALVVSKKSPFNTSKEAFAYIKANPGKIRWSLAINGVSHFTLLDISESLGGLDVTMIPSPGDKNRIVSLLGDNSDITMVGYAAAEPYIKSGDLKLLAMVNTERSPYAPDVPTLMEQGINASYDYAYSVLVAKGTPENVKKALADAFKKAVSDPKIVANLRAQCVTPYFKDAAETAKLWGGIEKGWGALAIKYGLLEKKS